MNTLMKKVSLAALIGAIGLGPALADDMGSTSEALMEGAADAETGSFVETMDSHDLFAQIDTDADGLLTTAEWAAYQGIDEADIDDVAEGDTENSLPRFSDYDLDGSGDITLSEFVEASEQKLTE